VGHQPLIGAKTAGIIRNVVLVTRHVKEFLQKLSAILARAIINGSPALSRDENFTEYRFEGAQNRKLAQGAHMSVSGPDSEQPLSPYSKPGNSPVVNSVKPRVHVNNI